MSQSYEKTSVKSLTWNRHETHPVAPHHNAGNSEKETSLDTFSSLNKFIKEKWTPKVKSLALPVNLSTWLSWKYCSHLNVLVGGTGGWRGRIVWSVRNGRVGRITWSKRNQSGGAVQLDVSLVDDLIRWARDLIFRFGDLPLVQHSWPNNQRQTSKVAGGYAHSRHWDGRMSAGQEDSGNNSD